MEQLHGLIVQLEHDDVVVKEHPTKLLGQPWTIVDVVIPNVRIVQVAVKIKYGLNVGQL
ncbi:MAG: hypothetical protein WBK70_07785 [Thermacetogeniaceae bacterium]